MQVFAAMGTLSDRHMLGAADVVQYACILCVLTQLAGAA